MKLISYQLLCTQLCTIMGFITDLFIAFKLSIDKNIRE